MAFDKLKTLRAAEKFLQMGKIPAAIKEYCQVVENEPDDFTTLNMLGDLYVRVGNQPTAVSCFRKIAEHYRDQDFALKAIAMYKKIDRLQPHDTEIATCLADLYAQQDLVVEARAHYLAVADAHNRSGATREALDVLSKIADLDPQNTEIRTRLAHGYLSEGMTAEAAGAFTEAGQQLVARGDLDEALVVFGRALELSPYDYSTLNGFLAAHSARGTADEAAEVIAKASSNDPEDLELMSMLASAYLEADEPTAADRVTAELHEKDPSTYMRRIEVARLYLRHDQIDHAVRLVADVAELLLAEREESLLLEIVNELLSSNADNVQALRLLVRAHWWQRDTENLKAALERMADAAQAAGLDSEERYALTQLTRLVPDQSHHLERLNQLGGAEEGAEEFTEFETVDETLSEEEIESADQMTMESEVAEPSSQKPEFEWNSVSEISDEWADHSTESAVERGFTFESVVAEELAAGQSATAGGGAPASPTTDSARAQELESVDFYIEQGYVDIALDSLDLLERQFGSHEDIELRRRRLKNPSQNGNSAKAAGGEVVFAPQVERAPAPPPVAPTPVAPVNQKVSFEPVIHPSLAEVFEEYRASAENESDPSSNGDYETHYNLGLAYKEMDLYEEALEAFQVAVNLIKPGDGTSRYLQCCNLLGHCFMQKGVPELALKWFEKGYNAPGASEDERQALRFELGAAYELTGDLERAIDIFTEVYELNVSYRGVNERLRDLKGRVGSSNGKSPGHRRNKGKKQRIY